MLPMSGYWTPNRNHPANQDQVCLFSNRNCHSQYISWALLPYIKDHSADVSLIISQLGNSLRAKRIPCPTRFIQINKSDAGHLVEVTCISVRYEQGICDHSNLVVDRIPDVPWTKLSKVSNRPYLQKTVC